MRKMILVVQRQTARENEIKGIKKEIDQKL